MRVLKDGVEYQGSPEDIAQLLMLTDPNAHVNPSEYMPQTLDSLVNESQDLRSTLAADPTYNPYPGVVASKESENADPMPAIGFAEEDTGIVNNG